MFLNLLKKAISIPGLFISDDDLRYGNSRIGMAGMSIDIGNWLVGGELVFATNFPEIKKSLVFPNEKWINKPVNSIEEWIQPITGIKNNFTINDFLQSFKNVLLQEGFIIK